MNCGLLCGLFMVKHHGLIITDVAVWILPFNQDPTSRFQIIRCCCMVPFPVYPIIGGDFQEFMKWGAYSQFSGTRTYRKQLLHSTRIWVLLCASLRSI